MVVERPLLLDTEGAGFWEVVDVHMGGIFEQILMVNGFNRLLFKINDINFAVGDVEYDDFLIIHLAEGVNDVVVLVFVENFAFFIEMNNALLLTRLVQSNHDKSIVVGNRQGKNFGSDSLQFDEV